VTHSSRRRANDRCLRIVFKNPSAGEGGYRLKGLRRSGLERPNCTWRWGDLALREAGRRIAEPSRGLRTRLAPRGFACEAESVVEQLEFYEGMFSAGALGTEAKRAQHPGAGHSAARWKVEVLGNHSTPYILAAKGDRISKQRFHSDRGDAANRTVMARSGMRQT
jgi:hypothetical protein